MDDLALNYQSDLNAILQMIADARRKAAYHVKDKIGCRNGYRRRYPAGSMWWALTEER